MSNEYIRFKSNVMFFVLHLTPSSSYQFTEYVCYTPLIIWPLPLVNFPLHTFFRLNRGLSLRDERPSRYETIWNGTISTLQLSQCVLIGADTKSGHGSTNQALSRQMTYYIVFFCFIEKWLCFSDHDCFVSGLVHETDEENPRLLNASMIISNIYLKHLW